LQLSQESVSNLARDRQIAALFRPMGRRVVALTASYGKGEQEVIRGFLTKTCEILEEEATRLRSGRGKRRPA